jgi:ribulose-5-phosphate 4-epimerase/fuculose-1-phosphate aldolase
MTEPLTEDLVAANRILFARGVVDAMGHVSARNPQRADRFFLARAIAPSSVNADDILEFDLDGNIVGEIQGKPYLERFIHAEIYRRRPQAQAVVHSHSPSVIPFGVTKQPLRPIYHMAAFLCEAVPVFDLSAATGIDTDLLISDSQKAAALSDGMKDCCAVLQRGHGSTIYGRSLREAVFRAVYLEVNATLQANALRLGDVTYLTPGEALLATDTNAGVSVDRCWDLWASQVAAPPTS